MPRGLSARASRRRPPGLTAVTVARNSATPLSQRAEVDDERFEMPLRRASGDERLRHRRLPAAVAHLPISTGDRRAGGREDRVVRGTAVGFRSCSSVDIIRPSVTKTPAHSGTIDRPPCVSEAVSLSSPPHNWARKIDGRGIRTPIRFGIGTRHSTHDHLSNGSRYQPRWEPRCFAVSADDTPDSEEILLTFVSSETQV